MPAGTRIGLGGIAKGYGVDRAMQVLIDAGVENAIVNAGGDLKALGTDQGKPWEVAIKHPRDRDRAIAVVPVSNVCLVTSGDYERFFEVDGVRYHHILDPRTGRPCYRVHERDGDRTGCCARRRGRDRGVRARTGAGHRAHRATPAYRGGRRGSGGKGRASSGLAQTTVNDVPR